jgi:glutamate racemase
LKIAFFDSGIGGLTVLKKALEFLPDEGYIYFADTENVPYGIKPKTDVKKFVFNAVDFLIEKNIKALVVACNTATAVVINDLRKKYDFPIIGMEPAIKPALINNSGKKILVLATTLTLKESKLEDLISTLDQNQRIEKLAMDKLVSFAEKFDFDSDEIRLYLKDIFSNYNLDEYESLVLGCTHFIFYKNLLEEFLPDSIKIIDGNEGTVRHLMSILEKNNLRESNSGGIEFYSSCKKEDDERVKKLIELVS